MKLTSLNPSTNQVLGEVDITTASEITRLVRQAHSAKASWRNLGLEGRNQLLRGFYSNLQAHHEELALLQASEMGMPITNARADITDGINYLNYYSDHALEALSPEISYQDSTTTHTVYREPRGVVAAIIPWNYPMSNFVWQCGQSLIAGNVVIVKPSEEVPLFAKKLEEIANQSALPKGVLSFVYGDGKVGDLLAHQNLDLLCFTGSTKVGKQLYTVAAEKFIPAILEMGGSAPGIIFEDCDVSSVINTILSARFGNAGQMCDALKRLLVHQSKYAETVQLLTTKLQTKKLGSALDDSTEVGPLVAERQVKVLETQVEDARAKGATIIHGGKRPSGLKGAYYEPTLITGVKPDMLVWSEEVFGPVLPIMTFTTEAEAIALANATPYGLGAYVFTNDHARFSRVAEALESGMVSLNNTSYLNPASPFGGYKQSGLGREHGKYGFHDVTQIKVVSQEN